MNDIDMKQKIKEVRDKFLSNNQIEDIRQNITLGVEERLKFLNAEQIKVVELLEEKHRELDSTLKSHSAKMDADKQVIEAQFDEKIAEIKVQFKDQFKTLDLANKELLAKQSELASNLNNELKTAIDSHGKSVDGKLDKLINEQANLEAIIKNQKEDIENSNTENLTKIKDLSTKNVKSMETVREKLVNEFAEKELKLKDAVDVNLSIFEENKKELLESTSANVDSKIKSFEKKIDGFLENHKTVEEVIDSRLKEFRKAQKAAFEELEAALNLLEKHQDETITRFKNNSEAGFERFTSGNSDINKIRNRGSIMHQNTDLHDTNVEPITDIEVINSEHDSKHVKKRSTNKVFKTLLITVIGLIAVTVVLHYTDIEIKSLNKFQSIFWE